MLSNTATPIYYGQFREQVLRGEIPVCKEVSMHMNNIDALIANRKFYYDSDAVEGFIKFCENELCLVDGRPLTLLPMFKVWAEDIFGWFYFVRRTVPIETENGVHYEQRIFKRRLRNKQYLIVGRGAAKSIYDECIQAFGLTVDTATTDQVTTAPTMKQANEVIGPFKTAIVKSRGPY